jgi:D-inositol-3-phosphate glycosyltransferase
MLQMFHTLGKIKQRIGRTAEEREGKYRIKGESHVIEVADLIIAATEDEQDQLFDLYQVPSEKVKIIPPGVNIHHFYPIPTDEAKEAIGLSPRDKAALFVGRIEPLKGVDTLLQAMAILKRNCRLFICPDYLIIIGGDPGGEEEKLSYEMTRLQSLSHELDLEDMVIFLGKRGQDTLPYYYSAAEVVVVPSHYESFGMVALEAMACGTPVIASRVGGLAHLVKDGETGFNVPAQDPDALAEKLRALFVDHDLRAAFGARAAAYARGFSWEIITKQMTEVYRELVVKTL